MYSALIFFPSLSWPVLPSIVPISQSCFTCAVNETRFLVSQGLEMLGVVWTGEISISSGINKLGLRKKILPELGLNSHVDCFFFFF